MRKIVTVFVHGIFSSPKVWTTFLKQTADWKSKHKQVQTVTFGYPSPPVRWNPLKRIPDLTDLGASLATFLDTDPVASAADVLVLVGHSQGGLVILQCLARALRENHAASLRRISECVLICTPTNGSQLLLSVRKGLGRWWHHPQEERLRPLNEAIGELQRTIAQGVVFAAAPTTSTWPLRITACVGRDDAVVSPASSRWIFPDTQEVEGTHSGAIQPPSPSAGVVRIVCGAMGRARYYFPADGDVIRTEHVTPDNKALLTEGLTLMKERFKAALTIRMEDLEHWLTFYEDTFEVAVRVVVGTINGKVVGFLMFHEDAPQRLIVVDYLATVLEGRASQVVTGKLIERLREAAKNADIDRVIVEVDQESEQSAALVRLFRAMGARVIHGLDYCAIDMNRVPHDDARHPHLLLYASVGPLPPSLPRGEVEDIVGYLYEKWYWRWLSRRMRDREKELTAFLQEQTRLVVGTIPKGATALELK